MKLKNILKTGLKVALPVVMGFYGLKGFSQNQDTNKFKTISEKINPSLQHLVEAYPDFLLSAEGNMLVWKDGTKMPFDDGVQNKSFEDLLNSPDLEDQMSMKYPIGRFYDVPSKNQDPGRIRYEPFFKKMYGNSKEEVKEKLVPIFWLPNTVNDTLFVTSVNGVDEKLQTVSNELDKLPEEYKKYLVGMGGTFNWRAISGTDRLSTHSFGIAIDLNVKYSNYWKWELQKNPQLNYKNQIPMEIVEIFEKNDFIWGGKWHHYDTMHFEYRPELINEK